MPINIWNLESLPSGLTKGRRRGSYSNQEPSSQLEEQRQLEDELLKRFGYKPLKRTDRRKRPLRTKLAAVIRYLHVRKLPESFSHGALHPRFRVRISGSHKHSDGDRFIRSPDVRAKKKGNDYSQGQGSVVKAPAFEIAQVAGREAMLSLLHRRAKRHIHSLTVKLRNGAPLLECHRRECSKVPRHP